MDEHKDSTRRRFLRLAGSAAVFGAVPIVTLRPAEATPASLELSLQLPGKRPQNDDRRMNGSSAFRWLAISGCFR